MTATTEDFARIVAHVYDARLNRDNWRAAWAAHLASVEPWRYRHPGGGSRRSARAPSPSRSCMSCPGAPTATASPPSRSTTWPARSDSSTPHPSAHTVRALRHLGAVERYTRPALATSTASPWSACPAHP
jgi:hypothetical protein